MLGSIPGSIQPNPDPTPKMNQLVSYLESHGVTVISTGESTVTVAAHYSTPHGAMFVRETIPATWSDVRAFLGY